MDHLQRWYNYRWRPAEVDNVNLFHLINTASAATLQTPAAGVAGESRNLLGHLLAETPTPFECYRDLI